MIRTSTPQASPDITVALCTYNRAALLPDILRSLDSQETDGTFTFEVLIVDDGSTDNTREVVQRHAAEFSVPMRYVRCRKGKGVGAARNTGVRETLSEWIAFIDDDEVADRLWLKELYSTAVRTRAPIVGGPVRLLLSKEMLARMSPLCRLVLGGYEYPLSEPGRFLGKGSPSTANVLLNMSVFRAIGSFETRGSAGEDTNLWRRAWASGIEMWYSPTAVVHHRVPPERLEEGYFRWNSLRWGDCFAQDDWQSRGPWVTLLACIARLGKAALVAFPSLLLALLSGNEGKALESRCALWRAQGYARRCLFLAAPPLFPQKRFFAYVDFREQKNAPVSPLQGNDA
jgi:glycosyltransferase involved in cell wall biosynthesis